MNQQVKSSENLQTSRKALVVEDDKTQQFIHQRLLEKLGFQVTIAEDGETALKYSEEEDYDVMLLDLGLPGILGEAVLGVIRIREFSTQKHLPIIVNTAHGDEALLQKCKELGADRVVNKPVSLEYLTQCLKEFKILN